LDVSITNKLRENKMGGVSSVNKAYHILERCEIGKLGLKGDKSRILKLTAMTNAQKKHSGEVQLQIFGNEQSFEIDWSQEDVEQI